MNLIIHFSASYVFLQPGMFFGVESENTFQSEPKGIPQLKSVTSLEERKSKEIELKCLFTKRVSLPTL